MRLPSLFFFVLLITACNSPQDEIEFFSDASGTDTTVNQKPGFTVTVTGTARYEDRYYNTNGFIANNTPAKAIRYVPIDIVSSDGRVFGSSITSELGQFEFQDVPVGDYQLRVYAKHDHSSGSTITIRDAEANLYAIEQSISVTKEQTTFDFRATISDRVSGIFNMLDVYIIGYDFVSSLGLNDSTINDLSVYWQWRQTRNSYTCRSYSDLCYLGPGIYIRSDPYLSGDTDEYDDDVLWHEFAHHLETSFSMLDSSGGVHSLTNYQLDLRLAWSEGMASAFALSIKKWLRANNAFLLSIPNAIGEDYSNYYIDTILDTTSVSVDLLAANSVYFRYASNEAAVASAILRLQNINGLQATWNILFNALVSNSTADTIEAFWDAQVGELQPSGSMLASWQNVLASKLIYYKLDDAEQDDSVNSAQPLLLDTPQFHTLYRNYYTVDEDWFTLAVDSGIQYQVETFDLINGADTQMDLFDSSYQLLASNDDAFDCEQLPGQCSPLHNGSNFSSKLTITAAKDDIYFVRVRTSNSVLSDPINYGYIARYGSYNIQATIVP